MFSVDYNGTYPALVVVAGGALVVVALVVVPPEVPPHKLTLPRDREITLGGGTLPPLKLIWNPRVKVDPAGWAAFQPASEKVQVVEELHLTLRPFQTLKDKLRCAFV